MHSAKAVFLQGAHAEEVASLKERQQLELKQAHETEARQKAAIEQLGKGISQLKLDQQHLVAKHIQETEAFKKKAEEAKNAAVEVCSRCCTCNQQHHQHS